MLTTFGLSYYILIIGLVFASREKPNNNSVQSSTFQPKVRSSSRAHRSSTIQESLETYNENNNMLRKNTQNDVTNAQVEEKKTSHRHRNEAPDLSTRHSHTRKKRDQKEELISINASTEHNYSINASIEHVSTNASAERNLVTRQHRGRSKIRSQQQDAGSSVVKHGSKNPEIQELGTSSVPVQRGSVTHHGTKKKNSEIQELGTSSVPVQRGSVTHHGTKNKNPEIQELGTSSVPVRRTSVNHHDTKNKNLEIQELGPSSIPVRRTSVSHHGTKNKNSEIQELGTSSVPVHTASVTTQHELTQNQKKNRQEQKINPASGKSVNRHSAEKGKMKIHENEGTSMNIPGSTSIAENHAPGSTSIAKNHAPGSSSTAENRSQVENNLDSHRGQKRIEVMDRGQEKIEVVDRGWGKTRRTSGKKRLPSETDMNCQETTISGLQRQGNHCGFKFFGKIFRKGRKKEQESNEQESPLLSKSGKDTAIKKTQEENNNYPGALGTLPEKYHDTHNYYYRSRMHENRKNKKNIPSILCLPNVDQSSVCQRLRQDKLFDLTATRKGIDFVSNIPPKCEINKIRIFHPFKKTSYTVKQQMLCCPFKYERAGNPFCLYVTEGFDYGLEKGSIYMFAREFIDLPTAEEFSNVKNLFMYDRRDDYTISLYGTLLFWPNKFAIQLK